MSDAIRSRFLSGQLPDIKSKTVRDYITALEHTVKQLEDTLASVATNTPPTTTGFYMQHFVGAKVFWTRLNTDAIVAVVKGNKDYEDERFRISLPARPEESGITVLLISIGRMLMKVLPQAANHIRITS